MGLLEGKVAIVTGAGGGLGRAHALAMSKEGAKLVINDLGGARDGAGAGNAMADKVVAEIREMGGEAVANYDSVATMEGGLNIVKTAVDAFGQVDILVNNAGILRDKTMLKMTEDMWDLVNAVHLKGTFAVTQPAVAQMRAQGHGGKVINTSSFAGLIGNIGQSNYGAAKAGIAGFTRVMGLELGRYKIQVNAIAPLAKTRMTEDISMVPDSITPDQIAPFVVFLASPLSDGVTGRIFGVHGPELFEYKQVMTPMVEKRDGNWTVQEIADKMDAIGRTPTFADSNAAAAASGGAASPAEQVSALFHAMPKSFKSHRAGSWETVLHFDVKGTGVFTLKVADGVCTALDGAQGAAEATVTFDAADTILGMAKGEVKPEQAFMAGKIKATDIGALMKFGKYFDLRKAQAAVDDVMGGGGGGGEQLSKAELVDLVFQRMPEGFLADKASGWNAVLHFEVGEAAYTVAVENQTCQTMKGKEGAPKATIRFATADVLLDMVAGKKKPEQAFMAGEIKADNIGELMNFGKCFDLRKGAEEAKKLAGGAAAKPERQGLNPDCLGRTYRAGAVFIGKDEGKNYASATDTNNGRYFGGDDIVTPPLLAVKPFMEVVGMAVSDRELNANILMLLHGEQEMIFHRPLKPGMLVNPRAEILSIEDKSSGQLLRVRQLLWADGELVNETISGYYIRGFTNYKAGNGQSKASASAGDEAAPTYVFEATQTVTADQPLRYADASGDHNPIHKDPEIAKSAGHPSIILHGLCTAAFAQNAIIDQYLDGNPDRLKRLKVRFSKVVLPGMEMTTKAWIKEQTAERTILGFETVNQDGLKVLSNAEAEILS